MCWPVTTLNGGIHCGMFDVKTWGIVLYVSQFAAHVSALLLFHSKQMIVHLVSKGRTGSVLRPKKTDCALFLDINV